MRDQSFLVRAKKNVFGLNDLDTATVFGKIFSSVVCFKSRHNVGSVNSSDFDFREIDTFGASNEIYVCEFRHKEELASLSIKSHI